MHTVAYGQLRIFLQTGQYRKADNLIQHKYLTHILIHPKHSYLCEYPAKIYSLA